MPETALYTCSCEPQTGFVKKPISEAKSTFCSSPAPPARYRCLPPDLPRGGKPNPPFNTIGRKPASQPKLFAICSERVFGFSGILGTPDSGMIRCSPAWYFMLGFFWPKNIHKQVVLPEPELQQKGPFFATSIPVYLTSVRFLLTKCRRRLTPMCRLTLSRKHRGAPDTYMCIYVQICVNIYYLLQPDLYPTWTSIPSMYTIGHSTTVLHSSIYRKFFSDL